MGADNIYEYYVIGKVINEKIQFAKFDNIEELAHKKICKKFGYSDKLEIPEIPDEDFKLLQPEPENEKGLQKFNFELMLHDEKFEEESKKLKNYLKGFYDKNKQEEDYQKKLKQTIKIYGKNKLINTDIKLSLEEIKYKKTLKVTFNLRKRGKNPLSQVQCNFNFFGEKSAYAMKPIIEVDPYYFDSKKSQRLNMELAKKNKNPQEINNYIEINNALDTVENTILETYHNHLDKYQIEPQLSEFKEKIDKALQKLKNSQNRLTETEKIKRNLKEKVTENLLTSYDNFLILKSGLAKSSLLTYIKLKSHLINFFKEEEIDENNFTLSHFDDDKVNSFIDYLISKELRNVSIKQYLLLLSIFFRKMGIPKKFPKLDDSHREKEYLNLEEMEKFLNIDVSDDENLQFAKDICLFILNTSFRINDVYELNKDNIRTRWNKKKGREEKYILSYIQKTGKNKPTYLSQEAENILIKYNYNLNFRKTSSGKYRDIGVFIKKLLKRDEYFHQIITIRIKSGDKETEIKKERYQAFSAHSFRHSCATYIVSKGGSVSLAQSHLGHSDGKMTQKYLHEDENAYLDNASDIFDK